MQNISYGIIIKNIRKSNGLTQLELANKIGVDKTTISAYEREKIMPPTDVFLKICKALSTGKSNSHYGLSEKSGSPYFLWRSLW